MIITPLVLKKRSELSLYEPVRLVLIKKFETAFSDVYIENTSKGVFSPKLIEALEKPTLYIMRVEKMSPDLTGYYRRVEYRIERVIVEIKARKIRIKDVYKTKLYGDVLNAEYAILVSSESLTREIREFIKENDLLNRRRGRDVIILKFNVETKDIIMEPKVLEDLNFKNLPDFLKINEV